MRTGERAAWLAVCLALLGALLSAREEAKPVAAVVRPQPQPGVRLSMERLHRQGGVPLGWQLTMPPGNSAAGRDAFDELGCPTCHRIAGEAFTTSAADTLGPELTGMGGHHPPAYFAEALLNPDAVLVDAPGYVGADGRSTMPTYPDMTTGQLSDVVAYLGSLKQSDLSSCHEAGASPASAAIDMTRLDLTHRPEPPPADARAFFVQTFDVLPGRLPAFEIWFATTGRREFLAADGVVSLETFVDAGKPTAALTTLIGFRDEAALRTFMGDPATTELWRQFDGFIGTHGHLASDRPLVYRAPSLSAR